MHAEYPYDAAEIVSEEIAAAIRAEGSRWTTEPPTEAGWYWARVRNGQPTVVKVGTFGVSLTGTLWAYTTGTFTALDLDTFDCWLGPIPPPAPPEAE